MWRNAIFSLNTWVAMWQYRNNNNLKHLAKRSMAKRTGEIAKMSLLAYVAKIVSISRKYD